MHLLYNASKLLFTYKKILKIQKEWSEAVNRGRTDNTMAKRKRTNSDLQSTTQTIKDRATQSPL
jgi:hypothetical protein